MADTKTTGTMREKKATEYSKEGKFTFADAMMNATGTANPSITQFSQAMRERGYPESSVRKMTKAYQRIREGGNSLSDYIMASESGYDYVPGTQPATMSGRRKGNRKGIDIGDAVGLGNNVALLAGAMRNEIPKIQKKEEDARQSASDAAAQKAYEDVIETDILEDDGTLQAKLDEVNAQKKKDESGRGYKINPNLGNFPLTLSGEPTMQLGNFPLTFNPESTLGLSGGNSRLSSGDSRLKIAVQGGETPSAQTSQSAEKDEGFTLNSNLKALLDITFGDAMAIPEKFGYEREIKGNQPSTLSNGQTLIHGVMPNLGLFNPIGPVKAPGETSARGVLPWLFEEGKNLSKNIYARMADATKNAFRGKNIQDYYKLVDKIKASNLSNAAKASQLDQLYKEYEGIIKASNYVRDLVRTQRYLPEGAVPEAQKLLTTGKGYYLPGQQLLKGRSGARVIGRAKGGKLRTKFSQ